MDQNNQQHNPTWVNHVIFSIIQMIFVPFLYGLIPLILTLIANTDWKMGDYEGYEKKTKVANIFIIIGWVLLAVWAFVIIGGIMYIFLGLATSGF